MSGFYEQIVGKPEIVTLVLKTRYPKVKRKMFCMNCGGFLQMTYQKVVLIVQGTADPDEIISEVKCHKCNAFYELC